MASGISGTRFSESYDTDMKPMWMIGNFHSPPPFHFIF